MQAPALQALRSAAVRPRPVACRFLAGRRFPTPHRAFRVATARRRDNEPSEPQDLPAELPEAVRNQIVNQFLPRQSAEDAEAETEEVTENPNGAPSNPAGSKDTGPYGSASRRAFRNVKRPPPSPPQLPSWFINGNVTLREDNDVDVGDLDVWKESESMKKRLKDAGVSFQDNRNEKSLQAGSGAEVTDDGKAPEKNALYAIDPNVWLEIHAMIAAGLNIPQDAENASSTRPHIMLHCPQEGGTFFLDFLTKYFALCFNADLVRIDAQDIAEIGGRYVRDYKDMHGNTLSALGYETYQTPPSREAQENDDMEEDEGDPADEEDDRRRPKSTAFQKPSMSIVPVQVSGGSFAEIFKSLGVGGGGPMPGKVPRQFLSPQSPNADNKDAKATLFVEALLDASEFKRKVHTGQHLSTAPTEEEKSFEHLASSSSDVPSDHSSQPAPDTVDEKPAAFVEARGSTTTTNPSQNIIILVRDYHEINSTQNGSRILERLHEVVQRKRGEGQRIMIIGTTTAEEILPSLSKSGLRQAQSDQSNSFTRTIVAPSTSPSAETQFAEEAKTRIENINIRHLRDMIRRISPYSFQTKALLSEPETKIDTPAIFSSGMDETVWSMDRVHRVATLALGMLRENEEMQTHHVERALSLMDISDSSKVKFLEKEAALEKQRSNSINHDPTSPAINTDERMKKLRKTCNSHEKKLLHGVIDPSNIRTTFADVRAPLETIEALKTLTSLSLVRPDAFTYGVLATDRIPGLLLYGPPGTGKTLLAKAVAKESGATVLEVSGSDVYDMYVGEGEKNIRAIFTLAKKLTPCIVFIDEADAILGSRGGSSNRTTHRELINQFLREWDGMTETSAFIMVATNRPFDLDEASLRRLPRRLLVDLPTEKDREAILGIHLKDEILAPDVSLPTLASQTPFYSGSDLKNLAVAAALACVREEFDAAATASKASSEESKEGETYKYPEKRTLELRHFNRAMEEISASISEDMGSLSAIRKFDEKYGDRRGRRKKLGAYGFGTVEKNVDGSARVRNQT